MVLDLILEGPVGVDKPISLSYVRDKIATAGPFSATLAALDKSNIIDLFFDRTGYDRDRAHLDPCSQAIVTGRTLPRRGATMRPLRHPLVPLDGRGHRTPATLLSLSERDHFLRAAGRGLSVGRIMKAAGSASDKAQWSWNCYVHETRA